MESEVTQNDMMDSRKFDIKLIQDRLVPESINMELTEAIKSAFIHFYEQYRNSVEHIVQNYQSTFDELKSSIELI